MKTILLTILLTVAFSNYSSSYTILKASKIKSTVLKEANEYDINLKNLLEYTKQKEGFRAYFYDDFGYACIGYGQRQSFYKYKISEPITREQADEILNISFDNHVKLVQRYYPKLRGNKLLSVAHMSYTIGLGRIIKSKIVYKGKLNSDKLLTIGSKEVRQYEIDLFNK